MLYSIHFFDGEGRETSWEEIECACEAEAINAMLDTAAGRATELWLGDRKLLWWPAETRRARPFAMKPRGLRRVPVEAAVPAPGRL